MSTYLILKWLHVLSGTILFGTGFGIAFFKWNADRSGDLRAIRIVTERTVLADWLFTTPAVIVQPLTGFGMIHLAGYPLTSGWIWLALLLYVLAGCCWLPVVWLQIRMRDIAREADTAGTALPPQYHSYARRWYVLGFPAFTAVIVIYWLMVFKPLF